MIERRVETPLVREIFPKSNGLFSRMNYTFPMPASQLDLLFFSDYGLKTIAPIVEVMLVDGALPYENLDALAMMVLNYYKNKWDRYLSILSAEYDPLHNFLDEYQETGKGSENGKKDTTRKDIYAETITADNSNLRTDNFTRTDNLQLNSTTTLTDDLTRTDNLTEKTESSSNSSGNDSGSDKRFGFNSAESVGFGEGSSQNSSQSSGTNTVTNTGTQKNTGTQTNVVSQSNTGTQSNGGTENEAIKKNESRNITEDVTDGETSSGSNEYTKQGSHKGNIGNITTQKLIREEIDVWEWNFVREVLEDAKEFLTLPMYVCDRLVH